MSCLGNGDVSLPPSVCSLPEDVGESLGIQEKDTLNMLSSEDEVSELDVDLPPAVASDGEEDCAPTGLDDELVSDTEEAALLQQALAMEPSYQAEIPCPRQAPRPEEAATLQGAHAFAEYYSPARTAPKVQGAQLTAMLSCDLATGWNFLEEPQRQLALQLLSRLSVMFLVVCPPCKFFSDLQRLWNFKKMSAAKIRAMQQEAMIYLQHSMEAAAIQVKERRYFAFEHPARASSWQTAEVMAVQHMSGVQAVVIDMCMLGMKSKVHRIPMRKRTRILTNSPFLIKELSGRLCDGTHEHQLIEGSEGGVRRSVWAQCYPAGLVEILARAAVHHAQSR